MERLFFLSAGGKLKTTRLLLLPLPSGNTIGIRRGGRQLFLKVWRLSLKPVGHGDAGFGLNEALKRSGGEDEDEAMPDS